MRVPPCYCTFGGPGRLGIPERVLVVISSDDYVQFIWYCIVLAVRPRVSAIIVGKNSINNSEVKFHFTLEVK